MRPSHPAVLTALAASLALAACASHRTGHAYPAGRPPQVFIGYTGTRWDRDYSVLSGHCDRAAIALELGSGSATLESGPDLPGQRSPVGAMLVGKSVDTLISRKVDRELDAADRACIGYALELLKPGRRIRWENPDSGVSFQLTAGEGHTEIEGDCRSFKLVARTTERKSKRRGAACQRGPGLWQMARL